MAAAEKNMEGLQEYTSITSSLSALDNGSLKEEADQQLQKSTLVTVDQLSQLAKVTSKLKEREEKPAPTSILSGEEERMKHLKLSHIYRQPPTRLTVK